jgi:5-methylcytosine-specific restriction endonuclease McrA
MPIKPENKNRYPEDWSEIRARILKRAKDCCEFCGLPNYAWVNSKDRQLTIQDDEDVIRVILTIAHLDHTPENCTDENLKALCQKCHNNYDIKHRKETRHKTRMKDQTEIDFDPGFIMNITSSEGWSIKITKY